MTTLYRYDVSCPTDGVQVVWDAQIPTVCPIDPNHSVTSALTDPGVAQARESLHLHDGAGRVFKLTVDQNGTLTTTQVGGPDPV